MALDIHSNQLLPQLKVVVRLNSVVNVKKKVLPHQNAQILDIMMVIHVVLGVVTQHTAIVLQDIQS